MSSRRFVKKIVSAREVKPEKKTEQKTENAFSKRPARGSAKIASSDNLSVDDMKKSFTDNFMPSQDPKDLHTSLTLKADRELSAYGIIETPNPDFEPELREIMGVTITLLCQDEIKNMSTVQVRQSKMNENKMNDENGVYDLLMGPIENEQKCRICGGIWSSCTGHPGSIELPYPLPHPIVMTALANYLTCFCEECHRLIMTYDQMNTLELLKFRGENRYKAVLARSEKISKCGHCGKPHGRCKVIDDKFFRLYKKKSETNKIPVSYEEIVKMANEIREKEFKFLGFKDPRSHPKNLIIKHLFVLPPCDRPFVESNGNCMHDDLTHKITDIIKQINKLQEGNIKEKTVTDIMDNIMFHIKTMMDNSRKKAKDPNGKRPIKSIRDRMSGKTGDIRQHIQGKRSGQTARSVISPDPNMHVNNVGVPREIAEKLSVPVRVFAGNVNECQKLVDEDRVLRIERGGKWINMKKWSNAKNQVFTKGFELKEGDKIVRNGRVISAGVDFELQLGDNVLREEKNVKEDGTIETKRKLIRGVRPPQKKQFKVRIGDVLERKLQNGDWALFNRQPTEPLC